MSKNKTYCLILLSLIAVGTFWSLRQPEIFLLQVSPGETWCYFPPAEFCRSPDRVNLFLVTFSFPGEEVSLQEEFYFADCFQSSAFCLQWSLPPTRVEITCLTNPLVFLFLKSLFLFFCFWTWDR